MVPPWAPSGGGGVALRVAGRRDSDAADELPLTPDAGLRFLLGLATGRRLAANGFLELLGQGGGD